MIETVPQLRARCTRIFTFACALHVLLFAGCIWLLECINGPGFFLDPTAADMTGLWLNSALLGLIGSLLYFSRKTYVYLITDKAARVYADAVKYLAKCDETGSDTAIQIATGKINGYLLYVLARPFAAVVIGPLLVMMVLAGLSTIGRGEVSAGLISPVGIVVIQIFSFVGGYKSSDMFDHFSKMGEKFIRKSTD